MTTMNGQIRRKQRSFIPERFNAKKWSDYEPYVERLLSREWDRVEDATRWIGDVEEIKAVLIDAASEINIDFMCDTNNEEHRAAYNELISVLHPQFLNASEKLGRRLLASPFVAQLRSDVRLRRYLMILRNEIELFREENLTLESDVLELGKEFSTMESNQTAEVDGRSYTMTELQAGLTHPDRSVRERMWRAMNERCLIDSDAFQTIYTSMVQKRHAIARNAGFADYRVYRFRELQRFDYTPRDCLRYHDVVAEFLKPINRELLDYRKKALNLAKLRPWDVYVNMYGVESLKPFQSVERLVEGCIRILAHLKPEWGATLVRMRDNGRLDLGTRKGKNAGAFCTPSLGSDLPFIFMNAAGLHSDVTCLLHECGHALHANATFDLDIVDYKVMPAEIAEFASIGLEFLSLDYWTEFYPNKEDFRRAKREFLEDQLSYLPWEAQIDAFQHWVYAHPECAAVQREDKWLELYGHFCDKSSIDVEGLPPYRTTGWHNGHIFKRPFYAIEYSFARLGAIQLWRRFRKEPDQTLADFQAALQLGASVSIPEVYNRAGVSFAFTEELIHSLVEFVFDEWRNA